MDVCVVLDCSPVLGAKQLELDWCVTAQFALEGSNFIYVNPPPEDKQKNNVNMSGLEHAPLLSSEDAPYDRGSTFPLVDCFLITGLLNPKSSECQNPASKKDRFVYFGHWLIYQKPI